MGLLPREREERAGLDGARLAALGAIGLVCHKFADVDVCHATSVTPATDMTVHATPALPTANSPVCVRALR